MVFVLALALTFGGCTPDQELSDPELYSKYCSKCHGEDGRGNESLLAGGHEVDLLSSRWITEGDRERVYRRIAYGYGQMPAYIDEVDPDTLERLVEITLRLAEDIEALDETDEATTDKATPTDTETPTETRTSEDDDHGSAEAEGRLPEARSAG